MDFDAYTYQKFYFEYKALVINTSDDDARNSKSWIIKWDVTCDYDIIMGQIYVLPMLEVVQNFSNLWPKVPIHLFAIVWHLSYYLHLVICIKCMQTHWRGMITSNFRFSMTWCKWWTTTKLCLRWPWMIGCLQYVKDWCIGATKSLTKKLENIPMPTSWMQLGPSIPNIIKHLMQKPHFLVTW